MQFLWAVGTRYASAVVQFVTAVLVARSLPAADTGVYLSFFGLVTATYPVVALGCPDGFVRLYPEMVAHGRREEAASQLRSYLAFAAVTGLGMSALFGVGAAVLAQDAALGIVVGAWWMGYAAMYVGSQGLVGLGRANAGTFMYYGSTNWFSLLGAGVYLTAASRATLLGVTTVLAAAACIAGAVAIVMLLRFAPSARGHGAFSMRRLLVAGWPIATGRVVQSLLIWSPVWVSALMFGSSAAATVGLASRLVMAVGAAIAVVKFTVRPRLVRSAVDDEWTVVEELGRRIALNCTVLCLAATIGNAVFGWYLLPRTFGSQYDGLSLALALLLIGVIIESMAGPADELLRMTDGAVLMLRLQAVTTVVATLMEVVVGWSLGQGWMLLAFSACFGAMYVGAVRAVYSRQQIIPAVSMLRAVVAAPG